MAEEKQTSEQVEDRTIDRLVDGELSSVERRKVVRLLAAQPDGWRRCALAFIEVQLLREELDNGSSDRAAHGTQLSESADRAALGRPALWVDANSFRNSPPWKLLAMAAGILLAFVAGYATHRVRPASTQSITPQLVDSAVVTDSSPDSADLERLGTGPWRGVRLVDARSDSPAAATFLDTASPEEYWQTTSAVPHDVQRQLQQLGVDVRQRRGFVPLRMRDGRHFVVPYEDVQIVPVNGPAF